MPSSNIDRRSFLKAAGGAAATASVAGCLDSFTGGGGGGGSLVYARGDHPQNYDPQQTTSGEVAKVTNQIFNQLIQFAPGSGGQLEDGLATEYSLEGTTATLSLQEDVTFHDGSDFTAADFRATVRRFIDPDYDYYLGDNRSGYGAFTFGSWVENIDASSDYELSIELTQQYAPFLRNLAMFAAAVLSKDQIESMGANPDDQVALGSEPVGTGPFELDQIDNDNQRVQLAATDDYWGDGPNVDEVIFKTIGQNSTRAQDVVNGDSHITDNLDSQSSQQIDDSDTATLRSKNGINIGYMAMNMDRREEFRDRNVRQAVSYAVNTEAIVNQIYEGFAEQADQPLPPDVLGYNDSIDPYPHDPDEAERLLGESDYGDGFTFELATFSNPRGYNPSPVETANQVKSDLESIGLTVNINQFSTFTSYLEYTDAGNHDACFLGWYTDNSDPDNFLYVLLDPQVPTEEIPSGQDWVAFDTEGYNTLNVAAWANGDYIDLVREAQRTYGEGDRRTMYEEACQIAHDEAPWVFIDYAQTLRGVHESVVEDSYTVSSVGGPYLNTVEIE